MNRVRRWAAGLAVAVALAAAPSLCAAKSPPAGESHPAQELGAAKRLACAYVQGINAGFTPQGRVNVKPPLDPNTPGLSISLVDADRKRAVIEEDALETPGVYMLSAEGLTVFVRYPNGGVTMVTVYPMYSGASDSFLMVSSHHGASTMPAVSQRYGLCRLAPELPAAPAAPSPPAAPGHGHP
uniref:Uncharacterized protein n=1 Tax=Desulfovibrio sp. U5L TaxID=596152 RepID=I2Q4W2_9BACT